MKLFSKAMAGRELAFPSVAFNGKTFHFYVEEDGTVLLYENHQVLMDDKGNEVVALTLAPLAPGEPERHAFFFPYLDGVPVEVEDLAFTVTNEDGDEIVVVLAKDVAGVNTRVKQATDEIPDAAAEELLADPSFGGFFFALDDETGEDLPDDEAGEDE